MIWVRQRCNRLRVWPLLFLRWFGERLSHLPLSHLQNWWFLLFTSPSLTCRWVSLIVIIYSHHKQQQWKHPWKKERKVQMVQCGQGMGIHYSQWWRSRCVCPSGNVIFSLLFLSMCLFTIWRALLPFEWPSPWDERKWNPCVSHHSSLCVCDLSLVSQQMCGWRGRVGKARWLPSIHTNTTDSLLSSTLSETTAAGQKSARDSGR